MLKTHNIVRIPLLITRKDTILISSFQLKPSKRNDSENSLFTHCHNLIESKVAILLSDRQENQESTIKIRAGDTKTHRITES